MRVLIAVLATTCFVGFARSTPIGVPLSDEELAAYRHLKHWGPLLMPGPFIDEPLLKPVEELHHTNELPADSFAQTDTTIEKRSGTDGLWTWQRPLPVVGKYPDGRLMCRIVTMTAGHTVGPCPPKVSREEAAKLLHHYFCKQHCCTEDGTPCGENWHVYEGFQYKGKHTYNNGYDANVEESE